MACAMWLRPNVDNGQWLRPNGSGQWLRRAGGPRREGQQGLGARGLGPGDEPGELVVARSADIEALGPWLDWAYATVKAAA